MAFSISSLRLKALLHFLSFIYITPHVIKTNHSSPLIDQSNIAAYLLFFFFLDEILRFMLERTFGDQACKAHAVWALNGTTAALRPRETPAGKILGLTSLGGLGIKHTAFSNRSLSLLRLSELNYRKPRGKKNNLILPPEQNQWKIYNPLPIFLKYEFVFFVFKRHQPHILKSFEFMYPRITSMNIGWI